MYIDSHAHLTAAAFDADRSDVIRRAEDAGVEYIINPSTNLEDSTNAIALASQHASVYACVGYHPHEAHLANERGLVEIETLGTSPKVVAIGEIGLDFHYDFSPREVQARVFRDQMNMATRLDLPVVIHTRESVEETVEIVKEVVHEHSGWREGGSRGVFHCFLGSPSLAEEVIRMGFVVSVPGVITFKNPGLALDIASKIPLEHTMLETDSPYLSPVPNRGKRNEPSAIPIIAERVAALRSIPLQELARETSATARRVFNLGARA